MGVVYEGYDPKLGRRVAVKTILPGRAVDADTARDYGMRFTREAKAAARLNHPNIVQVYDFGVEDDLSYLVMEYVEGTELSAFFESKEVFEIQDVTRLMTELLAALELAHNAGIVHRDIKPANVMVDSDGHAKLADFGVARVSDGQDATQVGAMVGTPAYMSPEQVQGQKVDRRTDIFSAGVILYQFLTGQKPFQGGGAYTLARMIIHDDPPRPSLIVESISPEHDRVIAKALAKNPDERYQTAREFAQALDRVLKGESAQEPDADSTRKISAADMPRAEAPGPAQSVPLGTDADIEFWRSIKDSEDIDDVELYLMKFPQGVYAALAQRKVTKLQRASVEARESLRRKEAEEAEARREVQAQAQAQAQAEARRAAEEKARLDAQVLREAQRKREAEAEAAAVAQRAAASARAAVAPTPAMPRPEVIAQAQPPKKSSMVVPALIGVLVVAGAGAAYFVMKPKAALEVSAPAAPAPARATAPEVPAKPEPRQEAAQPVAPSAPAPVAEEKKVADKPKPEIAKAAPSPVPAAKAVAAKPTSDPAAAKAAADLAAAKAAAEEAAAKAAAATAAAEQRAATAEAAAAKSAAERAAAEQRAATAEGSAAKAAAERAAAEKAVAAKAAAEKAAAEKVAADKARDSNKTPAAPGTYSGNYMSGVRNWQADANAPKPAAERPAAEKAAVDAAAANRARCNSLLLFQKARDLSC